MIVYDEKLRFNGLIDFLNFLIAQTFWLIINFSLFIILVVAGDKPHGCDICLKKFALACNLRAHMKTHEGLLILMFNI